ncbi:hypothetical protein DL765_008616 [Monosporascus sp. GIB2]|nr:hypothetical protein DL765_008616 [Monosporascus sp. GIB2]
MADSLKVLLTGSTGYILSALARGEDRARVLTEAGVNVELFEDLDQTELLENIASKYDSASNIAVLPSSGEDVESYVFSDKDNVHAYEKYRESLHSYAQRAAELAVVETGLATGVRTTVIMPPTVYGIGSGFFNRLSVQIPNVIQTALNRGRAIRVGDHNAVWNHVHIDDLVTFYEMVLARIVEGKEVPYGEKGILFTDGGEFAWTELYEGVAKALKKRGKLATEELQTLSLKEAAEIFTGGDEYSVEVGFASSARARGDIGREWGWEPRKTHSDFLNTFEVEADAVLEAGKSLNYASHLEGH